MSKKRAKGKKVHGKEPTSQEVNRLVAWFNTGRFHEAEKFAQEMIQRYPNHGFAWKALGTLLYSQERFEEALVPLQKAATLLASDAETHNNLGAALLKMGRLREAEAHLRLSLKHNPQHYVAHNNLGSVLNEQGRLAEAEGSLERALAIRPDHAEALNSLGLLRIDQSRFSEAEQSLLQAAEKQPGSAEIWNNLGLTAIHQGRHERAEECFRKALAFRPNYSRAFSNLLYVLNYDPEKSAERIFAVYREYDQVFCQPHRSRYTTHINNRDTDKRLRVGYVSPDFRRHSTRFFLQPLLENHDRKAVEVFAYADLFQEDSLSQHYKSCVDHWLQIKGMSDDAVCDRIRADGVDILVDLAGHTAHNRLGVFARKPAPVSATWLGYAYTTGLSSIDYFLTDWLSVPKGYEGLFSERPWRLPVPAFAYRPADDMGVRGSLPALARGYVTFGTLTRAIRINPRVIRTWSAILKRLPNARLVINSKDFFESSMRESLARRFIESGVDRSRLDIGYQSPPWDVLRDMDICLDCFPHNSGTTLLESLYMGVPFVTLADRPSVGRLGHSILQAIGRSEWVAQTEEEYLEKALSLAANLDALANVRANLRTMCAVAIEI